MYKTVGIYKNIVDAKKFEKYYVENVIPRLLTLPGVIKMKITNLMNSTREISPSLQGIQFIIETHYESIEYIKEIINTKDGQEIVKIILGNSYGTCGSYIGEEKTYLAYEK